MAKSSIPPATHEQRQAWAYYGTPSTPSTKKSVSKDSNGSQVGEVRYVVGWMADQMVRMGWRLTIDGSETWVIALPSGETIRSDGDEAKIDAVTHPTNASRRVLETIEWDARTVREVTTNLFVAGELNYVQDGERWRVVSVIRSDREALLSKSSINVRGIWPHPADPEAPDAPLFGVLPLLSDMAWLNRLSRSQSANRVGMRGILGIADEFRTADGAQGEAFWDAFESSLSRPMDSPEDVSPVGLRGSQELVEPKDSGMMGLSWIIPDFPYDEKVDERMEKLVQRLAYGLPIPPEILLGLQAQSKATAFQVEGSTYRAHIEPVGLLVSKIATDALQRLLPDEVGDVEVVPDPTNILARRHSISDVLEAFDRGAVNYDYMREVLGIPSRAEPGEEDISLRLRILGRSQTVDGVSNPAEDAASEPLTAAAKLPGESLSSPADADGTADDQWLQEALYRIDMSSLYELIGASEQAIVKARERFGAHIRSHKELKGRISEDVSNEELALSEVGTIAAQALGADADRIINNALNSVLTWWDKRVDKSRDQARSVLSRGNVDVSFSTTGKQESLDLLASILRESALSSDPIQESQFGDVVRIAGE